jgi:hypothetical protein
MRNIILFSALAFLLTSLPASADTVIEFKYSDTQSQFLTNGNMARINSRGTRDYKLVNFKSGTIYSVTPEDKQVTNLSSSMPSISGVKPPSVRLDIKPAGTGPVIAGYSTKKYRFSANGEYCGTLFASKEALKGSTIENMFGTIKTMADSHLESLGGFAVIIPTCQLASIQLVEKLQHIGAPMRVLDIEGNIDTEITSIIKNAGVEPHYYSFPANYRKVSMDEKIEQVLSSSTQTEQEQRPKSKAELRRMMRDLQRSGKMTPETREQMRHYREMMRQR